MIKKYALIAFVVFIPALASARTIQSNEYMVWGIGGDQIAIPSGGVITEAVLTIRNVTPQGTPLYIHLLDNTEKGLQIGTDQGVGDIFDSCGSLISGAYENGNYVCRFSQNENAQSPIRATFPSPTSVTLADLSTVQLSSALLELMDYAGNGRGFGIGIKTMGDYASQISIITLDVILKSYSSASSQQILSFSCSANSPVGHWTLNDNDQSQLVLDEGINNLDGIAAENTSGLQTEGWMNGAFQFTGSSRVEIPNNNRLDFGTGDFTVSAAVKVDGFVFAGSSYNCVLSKGCLSNAVSPYFGLYIASNNRLYFIAGDTKAYAFSNTALNDGLYHHVAAMRQSGQLLLYVDGVLQNKIGSFSGTVTNRSSLTLGGDESAIRYFNGSVDEVYVYNRSLTELEIMDRVNEPVSGTDGLVGHWSLDDNAAAHTVLDDGINGLNGTTIACTSSLYTAGWMNGAFQFAGSDRVTIPNNSLLDFGAGDFTVSTAVKVGGFVFAGSSYNCVLSKGCLSNAVSPYFGLYIASNNRLYFIAGDTKAYAFSNTALNDGLYHHVAAMRQSGQLLLYVDGVLQNKIGSFSGTVTNSSPLTLGGDESSLRYFNGSVDEVYVYNRSLTELEIMDRVNEPISGSGGLIGHWSLDDNTATQTVLDCGTKGLDGTATVSTSSLYTAGWMNGAFQFAGRDRVTIPNSSLLTFGTGDFTVSAAVKVDGYVLAGSSYNCLFGKGNLSNTISSFFGLYIASNNYLYFIAGDTRTYALSNNALNDGLYHHVAAMRQSGQLLLYVDGVLQNKIGSFSGTVTNRSSLTLGGDESAIRYFNGALDEVCVYNRSFSELEISALTTGDNP